jgi:hypothetical protein
LALQLKSPDFSSRGTIPKQFTCDGTDAEHAMQGHSEIKRLLRTIESLLENDPVYRERQEKVLRAESVRQRLEELRDSEIMTAFPDSHPEQGLLRPSLISEFIDKRPTTRDEWFRKIPHHLRTSVDSKQVSHYLDRILKIISDADR